MGSISRASSMTDSTVSSLTSFLPSCSRAIPAMVAALLATTTLSHGIVDIPLYQELGDAGELPATSQGTPAGILVGIDGRLSYSGDRDMYAITITDPSIFSAQTVMGGDTQLFLFDAAGYGIFSDDDSGGNLLSLLPAGNPALTSLTPGRYFLAISNFNSDPMSVDGFIFGAGNLKGPIGVGRANPIVGWSPSTAAGYSYSIALKGAAGAVGGASPIPEPTTALFGLALAGTALSSRRRKTQV